MPDSALLSARNSEALPVQPSAVSEVDSSELALAKEVSDVAVVTWSLHALKQCKRMKKKENANIQVQQQQQCFELHKSSVRSKKTIESVYISGSQPG